MVRVKTGREYSRRWVKKSIMAYLGGEKNEKWITGVIRASGLNAEEIKSIIGRLSRYGDYGRYKTLIQLFD